VSQPSRNLLRRGVILRLFQKHELPHRGHFESGPTRTLDDLTRLVGLDGVLFSARARKQIMHEVRNPNRRQGTLANDKPKGFMQCSLLGHDWRVMPDLRVSKEKCRFCSVNRERVA